MKRGVIAMLSLAALLGLAWAGGAWAAAAKSAEVEDRVKIDNQKTFVRLTKPTVPFNHAKHFGQYEVKCERCHHAFQDKVNVWKEGDKVRKCAECHKSPAENEEGGMLALMNAYHRSCRDCHKEGRKGPIMCEGCHVKE
jgi:DnaJ-class molecular chaperone